MELVFSDEFVQESGLWKRFGSDLDSLCMRDYGKPFFNRTVKCLDMDAYETSCSRQNDCTMDAAVGIGDYGEHGTKNCRFLLVELRLGYKNISNLETNVIARKISHTKDILSEERIHPVSFFVFTQNLAPVADSFFKRIKLGSFKFSCDAMSPEEFLKRVKFKEDMPYSPKNDIESISNGILESFVKGELPFYRFYDYWGEKIDEYRLKYDYSEASAILEALAAPLNRIETEDPDMSELVQMMKDDLNRKKRSIDSITFVN